MSDYYINIFYSDEDETHVADIPDLHHCSALSDTPEKALNEALQAKEAWLESAKANNKPIPKPAYKPAIYAIG